MRPTRIRDIKMNTITCPNRICRKEVSDKFDNCPFCGTPLHVHSSDFTVENAKKDIRVERSKWYSYASVMCMIAAIIAIAYTIVVVAISVKSESPFISIILSVRTIIGLSSFIFFSLMCAIVMLLAEIKQSIDNLSNKL